MPSDSLINTGAFHFGDFSAVSPFLVQQFYKYIYNPQFLLCYPTYILGMTDKATCDNRCNMHGEHFCFCKYFALKGRLPPSKN